MNREEIIEQLENLKCRCAEYIEEDDAWKKDVRALEISINTLKNQMKLKKSKDIKDYINLIEEWAKERGLDEKGTVEGQSIKTVEELSELIKAICKNDVEEIKDAIGDVFVTLVVGSLIQNKEKSKHVLLKIVEDWEECLVRGSRSKKKYYEDWRKTAEKEWLAMIISEMNNFFEKIPEKRYTYDGIGWIYGLIYSHAIKINTTLEECIEKAYTEIKNRKGKMVNGTFVKEEDYK